MVNLIEIRKHLIRKLQDNATIALVIFPMFLIISSNIIPAITSAIENNEIVIMAEAAGHIGRNVGFDTSGHHADIQISDYNIKPSSSPTSITPSPAAKSSESSNPVQLNGTPAQVQEDYIITPAAINAGDLVHVLWADTTAPSEIFYKRDGADFDPATTNLSGTDEASSEPAIAVSGSTVHVVWVDSGEILYMRSSDSGGSFDDSINLSTSAGLSFSPRIAVSGNTVHVVWADSTSPISEIIYKRSTDGGVSFQPAKLISGTPADESTSPDIAVSGNNVHIVWQDGAGGNNDVLYRRSLNGGSTFPNVIMNISDNVGLSEFPAIAVSDSNVHVVWDDTTPGNPDIFYRRSLDNGATFPNIIKNLSDSAGGSLDPAIAVSGNIVHVAWGESIAGAFEVLYRRSLNDGNTFPNIIKNLSSNAGGSAFPAIALSGNNVYVVWLNNTSNMLAILYRTSADSGNTFPPITTNLSTNVGLNGFPAIAVS
jgi:hypothetical protein